MKKLCIRCYIKNFGLSKDKKAEMSADNFVCAICGKYAPVVVNVRKNQRIIMCETTFSGCNTQYIVCHDTLRQQRRKKFKKTKKKS